MDLIEFKCAVCPKKYTENDINDIEDELLDEMYNEKSKFTKEDDFDAACEVVEKIFSKIKSTNVKKCH